MDHVLNFIVGFTVAFVGYLPPGMINMNAVRLSLEKGIKSAQSFSLGAALVVSIQMAIALIGASILKKNAFLLDWLGVASIPILVILSVYFFWQSRKDLKGVEKKSNDLHFMSGMTISFLNTIVIPFYLAFTTYLSTEGYILIDSLDLKLFMILGVGLGAFCIFYAYVLMASTIKKRANFIARNINLILSVLFLVLAFSLLFRAY